MRFIKHRFTKEELKIFDSSRGILSLLVVIAHINQIIWISVYGFGLVATILGVIANISVVVFFFLSGVLITYSGFNLINGDEFNYKKFFINRITRVYPTLLASLLLIFLLVKLFPLLNGNTYAIKKLPTDLYNARDVYFVDPLQIIKTVTLLVTGITDINGPMWSLFIEWWLYISAMFVFISIKSKNVFYKYGSLITSLLPLLYILYKFQYPGIFYIVIWFLGFLYTAVIGNNNKLKQYLIIASGISIVLLLFIKGSVIFNIVKASPVYFGFVQIFFAVLYLNYFKKLGFIKYFSSFAPFSYTLYLIHFPIILFIHSTLRVYTTNNIFYLCLETLFNFIVVISISYFLAKITENKNLFRKFLVKQLN